MRSANALSLNSAVRWLLFLVLLLIPSNIPAFSSSEWFHGASGYDDAMEDAKMDKKPLILYFNTEWCKLCKKMNSTYLANYEIEEFLRDIPKVEIDPDDGAGEKALAKKYSVAGYPTFFVLVPSFGEKTKTIYPFRKGYDLTPDEFVNAIAKKIADLYNEKAYEFFQEKRFEDAIKYYGMTIRYDPENTYAYYGKGAAHHTSALKSGDSEQLEEAEINYLKALDIDPNHKGAKEELDKLYEIMEDLDLR